jgi:MerR family redox-sensitive transcriptional activator SoxR
MEVFPAPSSAHLTIGELARRTGMSVSAIRFYESRGLLRAVRTSGNQRRFLRGRTSGACRLP